ncbi:MAG: TIGR02757 family protein [Candidatus Sericytochromatia bacterium]
MEQLDIFSTPLPEVKEEKKELKEKSKLHAYLDSLVLKYKNPSFITNDPIRFPHRYTEPKDQEIMGFIAAMMAQGKRTKIVESIEKIETLMGKKPYDYIANFNYEIEKERFKDFSHFAYKNILGSEIVCIFYLLKQVIQKYGSLKALFLEGLDPKTQKNSKEALIHFTKVIFSQEAPPDPDIVIDGKIKSLLPSPEKGSACKRLNMMLRWFVRKDDVDLGIWSEVPASMVLIPLDFHVSKLSRELGLTTRKQDDWVTAEQITERLKEFDPEDPSKYDFAIFGMGISGEKPFIP